MCIIFNAWHLLLLQVLCMTSCTNVKHLLTRSRHFQQFMTLSSSLSTTSTKEEQPEYDATEQIQYPLYEISPILSMQELKPHGK